VPIQLIHGGQAEVVHKRFYEQAIHLCLQLLFVLFLSKRIVFAAMQQEELCLVSARQRDGILQRFI
jgi:hypothetical protein